MNILSYNPIRYRFLSALAAVLLTTLFFTAFSLFADNTPVNQNKKSTEQKIHITSDSLITDNESNCAEFIGNVKAHQGPDTITAKRLKIYFKNTLNPAGNRIAGEESIEKIVANGDVIINFDNKVAVAQEAVYITDTRILVLTGANSKITSGSDSIAGEKITLFRADGRIKVESSAEKQVEAVFFSGEKGLN